MKKFLSLLLFLSIIAGVIIYFSMQDHIKTQEKVSLPLTQESQQIMETEKKNEFPEAKKKEEPPLEDPTNNNNEDLLDEPDVSPYDQWKLSSEIIQWNGLNFRDDKEFGSADCVDLENGNRGGLNTKGNLVPGGDLLSTLIVDDEARLLMNLSLYTPDYIKTLEKRVFDSVQKPFYAAVVCHVGNDIDVVGGSTDSIGENNTLVILTSDESFVHNDIRVFDNTATGGEFYACDASLTDTGLQWSCFEGIANDEDDQILGSYMKVYDFLLDGSAPKITERIFSDEELYGEIIQ